MTLSEELTWRGFVNQTTLTDITVLDKATQTFYLGFDASADSQTIGNLAILMVALTFMRHDYKAVILAGGATSLIGDPGGKDAERPMQSEETIARNVDNAKQQLERVLQGNEFTLVNNIDWTKDMSVLTFLRDVGKHFSITQMISRDYIAKRIGPDGSGISYTEFSYALLQAMDYLHLYRNYGVTLQLAGSDQWGNSVSGVDLIRKTEGAQTNVWTAPLVINKATGKKFGKTEDGAVWLDETKTSVYKFYQFWLNADDEGVIDYLKTYTTLDKEAVDELAKKAHANPGARDAQKVLAREVTTLVHGEARTEAVEKVTGVLFGGLSVHDLDDQALDELSKEIPSSGGGMLVDILTETGLVTSTSEARRLLQSGGIQVNGEKVDADVTVSSPSLIKKGKNAFALVR